jgi:hypothetical protein
MPLGGVFAKLAKQRLKRGVFHSLVSLQAAINRFVADNNADPRRIFRFHVAVFMAASRYPCSRSFRV